MSIETFFQGAKPQLRKQSFVYTAVFINGKRDPVALFENEEVAAMFVAMMTSDEVGCTMRPYRFTPDEILRP